MSIKNDQIEFHEVDETDQTDRAFHSDGYKIKGKLISINIIR